MITIESFYLPEIRSAAAVGSGLSRVRSPRSGEVDTIQVWAEEAGIGTVETEFDLKKNGTSVFLSPSNRPRITPGATASSAATANAASRIVAAGDLLTIDCTAVTEVPPAKLTFVVAIKVEVAATIEPDDIQQFQYIHDQGPALATWTITHNLGRYPEIITTDTSHRRIFGAVTYPSVNQAVVSFSGAQSGRADCR